MIHILTGEYPPIRGGVGDYTALIAGKLAEFGEEVNVWTAGDEPRTPQPSPPQPSPPKPSPAIRRIAHRFGLRGIGRLDRELNATPPSRLIVQWTPHSFGFRSLNVLVPLWLWKRARFDKDRVELMIHEPFLAFAKGKARQNLAAVVHRFMIAVLLRAASRVFVTIPAWETALRPWCFGQPTQFEWLPIPSNIDTAADPASVIHFRASIGRNSHRIVGHFGTYRGDITNLLAPALKLILETSDTVVMLAGAGSVEFHARFSAQNPSLKDRCVATGDSSSSSLAAFLSACDVLLQPYPDGISTRRGSAMAALALGIPVVSNIGHLSEDFWHTAGAVELCEHALAPSLAPGDLARAVLKLVSDPERRIAIAKRARTLYALKFDVRHTVNALRTPQSKIKPHASRAAA